MITNKAKYTFLLPFYLNFLRRIDEILLISFLFQEEDQIKILQESSKSLRNLK